LVHAVHATHAAPAGPPLLPTMTHPARDLGMARRLLYEIVQFYRAYPIMHTLCA